MIKKVTTKGITYEIHMSEGFEVSLVVPEVRIIKYEHASLSEAELTFNTIRDTLAFVRDVQR